MFGFQPGAFLYYVYEMYGVTRQYPVCEPKIHDGEQLALARLPKFGW
jgi:hypothetical protein